MKSTKMHLVSVKELIRLAILGLDSTMPPEHLIAAIYSASFSNDIKDSR